MPLSPIQIRKIQRLSAALTKIVADAKNTPSAAPKKSDFVERRRTGKELVAFRKMLAAERKGGASAADLAREHGVTPSYIYQLRVASSPKKKAAAKMAVAPKKANTATRKKASRVKRKLPSASVVASAANASPVASAT